MRRALTGSAPQHAASTKGDASFGCKDTLPNTAARAPHAPEAMEMPTGFSSLHPWLPGCLHIQTHAAICWVQTTCLFCFCVVLFVLVLFFCLFGCIVAWCRLGFMCARMASRCSISRCVGTVGVLGLVALLLGLPWLSPVRQAAVPTNLAPHSAAHAAREASDATSAGRTTVAAAPQLPGRRGYITTTAAESATSHALSLEPGSVVSDGQGKWFQVTEFVRSTAVEYRIDAQQPAIAADHTTVVRELSATGEVSNALAGTAPSLARPATEATHDDTSPPLLPDSAFTSPDAPDAPPNADESSSGEGFFTFGAYHSAERFQAGAHGEVWRGVRLSNGSSTQGGSSSSRKESVILKRIFVGKTPPSCQRVVCTGHEFLCGLDWVGLDWIGLASDRRNRGVLRGNTEKANGAYMSGLREIHFGILLRGCDHVVRCGSWAPLLRCFRFCSCDTFACVLIMDAAAFMIYPIDACGRFIESFNRTVPCPPATHVTACNGPQAVRNLTEMWLVFENGGTSLQQFLYKRTPLAGGSVLVEPSTFWQKLRTTSAGAEVLKELIRQVLMGLAQVHRQGVTHRDLKPGNVLVNVHNRSAASSAARIKLADFGSAVNRFASKHLYGDKGPTHEEETWEYRPPEVRSTRRSRRGCTLFRAMWLRRCFLGALREWDERGMVSVSCRVLKSHTCCVLLSCDVCPLLLAPSPCSAFARTFQRRPAASISGHSVSWCWKYCSVTTMCSP